MTAPTQHQHNTQGDPVGWMLQKLFSLKFGLIILALIGLASIAGTLIPDDPETGKKALQRAQELVFYSIWFQLLLALLALNMTGATMRTFRRKVLPTLNPRVHHGHGFYQHARVRRTLRWTAPVHELFAVLGRHGLKIRQEGSEVLARRGTLRVWGAPVSHLGVILVLTGSFLAAWVAQEGMIALLEGEQTEEMGFWGSDRKQPIDMTIVCEDFETDFYPGTQIPSVFRTSLRVQEKGKPDVVGPVEVNKAIYAGGWKFHQSSYQEIPGYYRYRLEVVNRDDPNQTYSTELSPGQLRDLPGGEGLKLRLMRGGQWMLFEGREQLAEGRIMNTDDSQPWQVRYVGQSPLYRTVLTIKRNPMMPFIYAGCGIMMLGLMISFSLQRVEISVLLESDKGLLYLVEHDLNGSGEFSPRVLKCLEELEALQPDEVPVQPAEIAEEVNVA